MRLRAWVFPALAILVAGPALYVWHHESWLQVRPGYTRAETIYFDPDRIKVFQLPLSPDYPIPIEVADPEWTEISGLVDKSPEGWILLPKGSDPIVAPGKVLRERAADARARQQAHDRVIWAMPGIALLLGIWLGVSVRTRGMRP